MTNLDKSLLEKINVFQWDVLSQLSEYKSLGDLAETVDVEFNEEEAPEKRREVKITKGELRAQIEKLEQVIKHFENERPKDEVLLENLRNQKEKLEGHCKNGDTDSTIITIHNSYRVLGLYIRETIDARPKVVLYTKAIQNAAKPENADKLLQIVYVHEMIHAFYDHDHSLPNKYIPYIEEPLTEYAMLKFMKAYQVGDLEQYAIDHVKEKQTNSAICFYGFGAYLHEEPFTTRFNPGFKWIAAYREAKYQLNESDEQVKTYEEGFRLGCYPLEEEFNKAFQLKCALKGQKIQVIEEAEFYGNQKINYLSIPDTVTEIKALAFENCTNLTRITIPDSVNTIGNMAFERCSNLKQITIPDSVTKIGDSAFEGCPNLQITIPNRPIEIGNRAFEFIASKKP